MTWYEKVDQVVRPLWIPKEGNPRISTRGRKFYLLLPETRLVPQGIYDTLEEAKGAAEGA